MKPIRKSELYKVINYIYLLASLDLLENAQADWIIDNMLDRFGIYSED